MFRTKLFSFIVSICFLLICFSTATAQTSKTPASVYIDGKGVMRWSDTKAEASFYGVNYTLPFAHAYRAANYLGIKHKETIDRDVYHFARLGFNAYRIHIWDVEISDGKGNLIENEHLDLLDYLIGKLRERNIRVLITTMTNFGNGYPEKNQNTGAFSYLYDKCDIHSNPAAIAAQENYIAQLLKHKNPYTQSTYPNDPYIVGFEINNEPCHSTTAKQTETYINKMLKAIKSTGNKKPVFYNVSHNMDHVASYFNTAIQGTTYQWYPVGLVAGHKRQGNFLPNIDNFNIPFSNIKGFQNKAKAIYEYDPADNTYSYIHPAMTRTFRSNGFQWITQFAYDPIDMAQYNTEYQTHYLNLAYTPAKAISLKISAEVVQSVARNAQFPKYPNDTVFGAFRVSYAHDLSEMNTPEKFYYTNNTDTKPVQPGKLETVAGHGSSNVVGYEGTGAYFLDKLEDGLWRLEVMPDVVEVSDPFEKPSLLKQVAVIAWNRWKMSIEIPDLGKNFSVLSINKKEDSHIEKVVGKDVSIVPGVYLLCRKDKKVNEKKWNAETQFGNIKLGEFVAPAANTKNFVVVHQPAKVVESDVTLTISANIVGPGTPDSVLVYTDNVSFWNTHNPYVKMTHSNGYTYTAEIPANMILSKLLRYNIVVFSNDKKITFPDNINGNPLDWDYLGKNYYESATVKASSPIELVSFTDAYSNIDSYGIPESSYSSASFVTSMTDKAVLVYKFTIKDDTARFYWSKNIMNEIRNRENKIEKTKNVFLNNLKAEGLNRLKVCFVTSDGFTYSSILTLDTTKSLQQIALNTFVQDKTVLLPAPYPSFLSRYFTPNVQLPFEIRKIESIVLSTVDNVNDSASVQIGNIWLD